MNARTIKAKKIQVLETLKTARISNQNKDKKAFESTLFRAYFKLLYARAYHFFGAYGTDDVVQNFYIKKVCKFKLNRIPCHSLDEFESFIFKSFINHCRTELSSRKRRVKTLNQYNEKQPPNRAILQDMEAETSIDNLRQYLKILELRQQIALWLKVEGLSHKCIGNILGVTPGAVTDIIYRAKNKIKNFQLKNKSLPSVPVDWGNMQELVLSLPERKQKKFLACFLLTDLGYEDLSQDAGIDANKIKGNLLAILVHIRVYYSRLS